MMWRVKYEKGWKEGMAQGERSHIGISKLSNAIWIEPKLFQGYDQR
jgi:hypothetical protein